ncbi:MAG: hypothetical protein ACHQET_01735 [Chitinophagales bacterium]
MFRNSIKSLLVKYNRFSGLYLSMLERMNIATSKGAISQALRKIDEKDPETWEFSCFSQNGEDGIIEFLTSKILEPNKYFIEIGSSDGLENNSAFLAFVLKYGGLMIEGDAFKSNLSKACLERFNHGVKHIHAFMNAENAADILEKNAIVKNPDFFSLDIDGNDFYIMESILKDGMRPKIICVEYNSTYGPENAITIMYDPAFNYWKAHPTHWYYGVSIAGWRKLLGAHGFEFITVDSNGVNAFFIDPACFPNAFSAQIKKLSFKENFATYNRTRMSWERQFDQISKLQFHNI